MRRGSQCGPHRASRNAFTGIGAGGILVVVALLLLPSASASGVIITPTGVSIHGTGSMTGAGAYSFCGSGVVNSTSGYVCLTTSVSNATGSAKAESAVGTGMTFVLPRGSYSQWLTGSLHLAAGYAFAALNCSRGDRAQAFVTIFFSYHVKYLNGTGGGYGFSLPWIYGPVFCPRNGGYVNVSSPVLDLTFNSSTYGTSYGIYSAGTYVYSASVGCEAQVAVRNASLPVTAVAGCNAGGHPSANTMSILTLALA